MELTKTKKPVINVPFRNYEQLETHYKKVVAIVDQLKMKVKHATAMYEEAIRERDSLERLKWIYRDEAYKKEIEKIKDENVQAKKS